MATDRPAARPEPGSPPDDPERDPWWLRSVGYEVYIRSFADSDADGIGDLRGLRDRLEYLAWLGIDLVWITPFYPSPMADFGYDVADYTGVHELFGSLTDVDDLIAEADRLGIRVIIDIVPNHTSIAHPWFREALADPTSPKRDYYLWRDPPADGSLPNNWVSYFGGPTWTLDPASGQYYLHMFLPEQPDLNWQNPDVIREFDDILRFWLDRGVAGFRIDVAQAMGKDPALRSNPELTPVDHDAPRWSQWLALDHAHDVLQPHTLDIFRRWREILAEYDAVLVGETYVLDADELAGLMRGDGLDVGFWFRTMHMKWDAVEIRSVLEAPSAAGAGPIGWVQASHDEPRPPTRFGGGDLGRRRSLGLSTLLLGLPGVPFLYQGEELAIEDGEVPADLKADPVGGDDVSAGRDGCRTPMPWSTIEGEGFSTGSTTWLPSTHTDIGDTVAGQREDATSPLHQIRHLISLRRELDPVATADWIDIDGLVAFRRGDHTFALNPNDHDHALPIEHGATVRFRTTGAAPDDNESSSILLHPDEAVIIRST